MAPTETSFRFEQPRSTFGTWLGVVLLFAVFALFVWVIVGAMPRGDDYEAKKSKVRVEKLQALHKEIDPLLSGYAWVDKAKGTVRIPIQRAMELTITDLAQKKPVPAGPIATPAPAPAPAGAAPTAKPGAPATGASPASAPAAAPATAPPPAPAVTPAAGPVTKEELFRIEDARPSAPPVKLEVGTPVPALGATPKP